jgi:hypothetical protein
LDDIIAVAVDGEDGQIECDAEQPVQRAQQRVRHDPPPRVLRSSAMTARLVERSRGLKRTGMTNASDE